MVQLQQDLGVEPYEKPSIRTKGFMMLLRVMAVFAVVSFNCNGALAAGDAEEGRRLARQWCSSCHIIGSDVRGADAAPPFQALADDPTKTELYLKTWISNPHPPMPDFNLARQDVEDLTAYIRSLSVGKSRAVPNR